MTDKILEVRGLTKTYGGEKKQGAKQPASFRGKSITQNTIFSI